MHNFLRLISALCAAITIASARDIGEIEVKVDARTIPIRVSASPEPLDKLAQLAFESHGRYRRVASGHTFDIRFTGAGANQVRVDITRGSGAAVVSEIVRGANANDALLRAADLAVVKTNGEGLRGFFTARLAFIGQRTGKTEVYVSDLFLREVKQVTHNKQHALTPRWSPDGSRVLYTSYFKSGSADIFLLDVNTGRHDTIASFRGMNTGARFSPNGRQIAMVLSGEGATEIYVSDANGRNVARRTRSDTVKSSPCWSPDGAQIVFAMEPGPQLYVLPAGGGTPRKLSLGLGTYAAEPDWSRTSPNKIACTVRQSGRYQIAVYDAAAGRATKASEAPFDGIEPSWLADGRHLVYTARDRSTSVLCILDTETGKSTRITPTNFGAMQASVWTP